MQMRLLDERIDSGNAKLAQLEQVQESQGAKQEATREEMGSMYTTFTGSVGRVLEEVGRIKGSVDAEILLVRNSLNTFRHEMNAVKATAAASDALVSDCDTRMAALASDVTAMRAAILEFTVTTARQRSLLECIDQTKVMCNQFNHAVRDLRNQIDTTDAYIENYLPFRTVKELTALLSDCQFDAKTHTRIKAFEARRIKDMYARMVTQVSRVPDFKARLTEF